MGRTLKGISTLSVLFIYFVCTPYHPVSRTYHTVSCTYHTRIMHVSCMHHTCLMFCAGGAVRHTILYLRVSESAYHTVSCTYLLVMVCAYQRVSCTYLHISVRAYQRILGAYLSILGALVGGRAYQARIMMYRSGGLEGVGRASVSRTYHSVSACSHALREGTRVSRPYHRVSACIMVRVSWVVYRVWGSRIIVLYRVVS